ncbi:putative F-box/FBD/LRR-repeat protein At1g78760 isoform X2 [Trifolium pratense]|uniref:putative F-box/FBD/LRR-repeat protein At1g78760 isoform X2 n=1 Tax=Trifolium pratense TaxID=57577 RepID=UPI001E693778|nr:putative F-box/FBD/LRR-repeat protein At1g78760 isoform X2 [Trifolium pratense]
MKKQRQCENENGEIKGSDDRLSDLPDCVLLHIFSFLNTKHVVQTCILSKRWRHLWKRISTLILHSSSFTTKKRFTIFMSKILTLRDTSIALHALDLDRSGDIEPLVFKKILNYVSSHKTHLKELGISVGGADSSLIMSCVSSCHALTSLKLSISSMRNIRRNFGDALFPKSLNLPALTSLDLTNFVFCGGESGHAEPFSAFTKLISLVLHWWKLRDAQILSISNETLVNLAMHNYSHDIAKIEISAKCLRTFTITGYVIYKICGSSLSSVKQVNIDAQDFDIPNDYGLVLLSWLQDLANVESLTVTSTTLQILSLVPGLLEVQLPSLCNLKSLEVELKPMSDSTLLYFLIKEAMLEKAAAGKSRKEVAKLKKAFKCLEPPAIPDGIVDFLKQNSQSAKVNITTDSSTSFNLKQIVESIKGAKYIKYPSQFTVPDSSSVAPASASSSAAVPATVAPPNLHLCCAEKNDASSNEDKVEMPQPYTNSPLQDNGV